MEEKNGNLKTEKIVRKKVGFQLRIMQEVA